VPAHLKDLVLFIVRYKLRCVKDSPVLIGDYQLFHETGVPENARRGLSVRGTTREGLPCVEPEQVAGYS